MSESTPGEDLLDRMIRAAERVRRRLLSAAAALERAGILYAAVGDAAVAAWVSTVDESAVRNMKEIEILIRRADLAGASTALVDAGFSQQPRDNAALFLDERRGHVRHALRLLFAGERIRPTDLLPAPHVDESQTLSGFRVVPLDALATMKLASFRTVDRVHLRDLVDVGLIDETWCARYPPQLALRLREILDTPDG